MPKRTSLIDGADVTVALNDGEPVSVATLDEITKELTKELRRDVLSTSTRELLVRLTVEELAAVARELAGVIEDIEQETADQVEEKAGMKQRLADMLSRQRKLAMTLRRGTEERSVPTETIADYAAGIAVTWRTDTGEEVGRRVLTDDERQPPLLPEVAAPSPPAG